MTTAHTARPPRRKIIEAARWDSRFKVGQHVTIDGGSCGDYHGRVVQAHRALQLQTATGELRTLPGVTVEVRRWEGVDYHGAWHALGALPGAGARQRHAPQLRATRRARHAGSPRCGCAWKKDRTPGSARAARCRRTCCWRCRLVP